MDSNEIFYYYLRTDDNHPYGCVAIQETGDGGRINRGVSICSKLDKFDRQHARGLALTRLKLARNSLVGEPFATYHGDKPTMPPIGRDHNKYDCNVEPTEFEYRILHIPKK